MYVSILCTVVDFIWDLTKIQDLSPLYDRNFNYYRQFYRNFGGF